MKTSLIAVGIIFLSVGIASAAGVAKAPAAAVANMVEVGNKFCPVSKEQVGKEGMEPFKIAHNGKMYNLCCSMCAKDFKADPAKFSKIADDEAAAQHAVKE